MTAAALPTDAGSILVVDDEPDACANLQDILSAFGYRVDVAYDGPRALALAEKHAYDVALLDFKMPGMNGVELYRRLKTMDAALVAILVTAYAGPETARDALSSGAWRILPKPVQLPKLLGLVQEAFEQPLLMIIDDDADLCRELWESLRTSGYRVCLARDWDDAAERLRQRSYVAVLIDARLSEGRSEALRLVREAHPQARTILVTDDPAACDAAVRAALEAQADAVCNKPLAPDDVVSLVRRLMESHRRSE